MTFIPVKTKEQAGNRCRNTGGMIQAAGQYGYRCRSKKEKAANPASFAKR
jgi:tRNA(Ile2) C34 agmatinyltransferase TiaS